MARQRFEKGRQEPIVLEGFDSSLKDGENSLELVLDGGACGLEMSTVIDMTGDTPEVIREGKGSLQPFGISNG